MAENHPVMLGKSTVEEREKNYELLYNIFEVAANHGIYEAFYYIGVMYLEGLYLKQNDNKAFYNFCLGAGELHALSFYQIYKM